MSNGHMPRAVRRAISARCDTFDHAVELARNWQVLSRDDRHYTRAVRELRLLALSIRLDLGHDYDDSGRCHLWRCRFRFRLFPHICDHRDLINWSRLGPVARLWQYIWQHALDRTLPIDQVEEWMNSRLQIDLPDDENQSHAAQRDAAHRDYHEQLAAIVVTGGVLISGQPTGDDWKTVELPCVQPDAREPWTQAVP